jgi:hypothetical protein
MDVHYDFDKAGINYIEMEDIMKELTSLFVSTAQFLNAWAKERQVSNTWELSNFSKVKKKHSYLY